MNKTIAIVLLLAVAAVADTHNAASAEYAACSTAVALASAGDTIIIPDDSASWDHTLSITKRLIVLGAGSGKTKISFGTALPKGLINISGVKSDLFMRISGIKLSSPNISTDYYAGIYSENGTNLKNIRVDHIKIVNCYHGIYSSGFRGVFDNDTFINSGFGISYDAGSDSLANSSWDTMLTGTENALFVEDCQFIVNANVTQETIQERIGTSNGGKLVVRYCVFDYTGYPYSNADCVPIQLHGNQGYGSGGYYSQVGTKRGQSVCEFYNNTILGDNIFCMFILRSSSALIYNNTCTTSGPTSKIFLGIYEEESPGYVTVNPPSRQLWPAEDQVHNSFFWNNTINGNQATNADIYFPVPQWDTLFIKQNRDYFFHAPQASGGYEYFVGRNGASSTFPTNKGTSSEVDSSATDSTGTMIFEINHSNAYYPYIPYQYPHILRKENKVCFINIIRP